MSLTLSYYTVSAPARKPQPRGGQWGAEAPPAPPAPPALNPEEAAAAEQLLESRGSLMGGGPAGPR